MKGIISLVTGLLASTALARDLKQVGKAHLKKSLPSPQNSGPPSWGPAWPPHWNGTHNSTTIPQNKNTTKFAVNDNKIPDVNFNIGESYAGLLPISNAAGAGELYFWFFPSANPAATDEIVIWLNGGPGCSSLEGLLQENGNFLWQYGTYKPVKNVYAWTNLTNMVWVEQPVGTGFSKVGVEGAAQNELDVAKQFVGWWKNFVDTFNLHNRKVYITGESYAGQYVPYIADAFHNQTDKGYYDVEGILIYDPSITENVVSEDIPVVPFIDTWPGLFSLNQTFINDVHTRWETCGYGDWYRTALGADNFPPKGPLPQAPNVDYSQPGCELWNDIYNAVTLVNPCFDIYAIATTCPLLWDVLGFPGSIPYLPDGATIYFNRTDVQKAINAPLIEWNECTDGILPNDNSPPSALSVLPRVIEKNTRTIIGHGLLDMILIANGSLAAIQNMTWHGKQGFSTPPYKWDDFFVPYHPDPELGDLAGAGVFGQYHTERALTFVTVDLSGHMVPQYAPSASYRHLEFLLGRIPSLGAQTDFTTQSGDFGNGFVFVTANETKHH